MPPRPFPCPLRVGTDICHIPRIRKIIAAPQRHSKPDPLERFLSKLLTWPERQYFWQRFKSRQAAHENITAVSGFLAGRWAAKEACRKACDHLHPDARGFRHIIILPSIRPDPNSSSLSTPPRGLILHEPLAEQSQRGGNWETVSAQNSSQKKFNPDELDGQYCEISISHDTDYATAVAIVPSMKS